MVGLDGIRGDDDSDPYYEEQNVDDRPPGEGWEVARLLDLYLGDDAADESHHPCELEGVSGSVSLRLNILAS